MGEEGYQYEKPIEPGDTGWRLESLREGRKQDVRRAKLIWGAVIIVAVMGVCLGYYFFH